MKKLLKVTLSLLCVLSMTGCGSKESKADTNKNKEATTQKQDVKKRKSSYFKDFENNYTLNNSSYSINIQKDAIIEYAISTDYFSITDKNDKKLKLAVISSLGDKNMSLQGIKEKFSLNRERTFLRLYDYKTVTINTINDERDITIKKFNEALYETGTLSVTNYDKTPNYVTYRFLTIDEDDDRNIFELIVCSDDYEEKDLKNIAEELISQIHETK